MFDLKAKLLNIGLVTKEQVEKVEREKKAQQRPVKARPDKTIEDLQAFDRKKAVDTLKSLNKNEQYIMIRKWVVHNRLDRPGQTTLDDEKFFIPSDDGQISWITLKPELIERIKAGEAGVIGFMSDHGYAHAVVPRDIAEDVGEVFAAWVKVLNPAIKPL